MKARDARLLYLSVFALALVAVLTCSAVIGVAAVTPFAVSKLGELYEKFKENHREGMPAAKAAKAKLDELKKEQAKLVKDKKALEKKKLAMRKEQAKKLYEERQKIGYENSLSSLDSYRDKVLAKEASIDGAEKAAPKAKTEEAKPEKIDKSEKPIEVKAQPEPVAEAAPITPLIIPEIEAAVSDEPYDYTANGSLFRGISF
ncbi:MAG: hypothetical protein Q4A45_05175 [Clostridia bacterium]|nr:hypothetical protein [Clostridia bacterium]